MTPTHPRGRRCSNRGTAVPSTVIDLIRVREATSVYCSPREFITAAQSVVDFRRRPPASTVERAPWLPVWLPLSRPVRAGPMAVPFALCTPTARRSRHRYPDPVPRHHAAGGASEGTGPEPARSEAVPDGPQSKPGTHLTDRPSPGRLAHAGPRTVSDCPPAAGAQDSSQALRRRHFGASAWLIKPGSSLRPSSANVGRPRCKVRW